MNRDYANRPQDQVGFFVGTEVEHTPARGMKTLFVVGLQPVDEILNLADSTGCAAVYFGANMSFEFVSYDEIHAWVAMIKEVLEHPNEYMCTLDFDVRESPEVSESELVKYRNFIPMVSVKVPHAVQLGYNATIKIDDSDFKASNPGVWCHSLHTLMDPTCFTPWRDYTNDVVIERT